MHCAQARNQIALLVGDDIADTDRLEVEQHLSQCNACREYKNGVAQSHQVLQTFAAEDSGVIPAGSLWEEMQPAVKLESSRKTRRFNGWVAALAVAALVMAMVAISGDLAPDGGVGFEPAESGFNATPVGNQEELPKTEGSDKPKPFPGTLR